MRLLVAIAFVALAAFAVPVHAESIHHCVAQDACTAVAAGHDGVCVYNGQGRGSSVSACATGDGVTVTRCEAGRGCRTI